MKFTTKHSALLIPVPLLILMAGCGKVASVESPSSGSWSADTMPLGEMCVVYFRRDAMGAATEIPIPIGSGNHNGADITMSGKIVSNNNDWLVIETVDDKTCWIARDVILYVSVRIPQPQGSPPPPSEIHAEHPSHEN